jgi:hypothetical protein
LQHLSERFVVVSSGAKRLSVDTMHLAERIFKEVLVTPRVVGF